MSYRGSSLVVACSITPRWLAHRLVWINRLCGSRGQTAVIYVRTGTYLLFTPFTTLYPGRLVVSDGVQTSHNFHFRISIFGQRMQIIDVSFLCDLCKFKEREKRRRPSSFTWRRHLPYRTVDRTPPCTTGMLNVRNSSTVTITAAVDSREAKR